MTATALAVAAALLGIASALLFAIRARDAERAAAGLGDRLASALREAERLRALSRVEASDRAGERDRLLRRATAAEATAHEWSDRAALAEADVAAASVRLLDRAAELACQLAEINQAKIALASAEKEIALLSTERDLLRAKLDARSLSQN